MSGPTDIEWARYSWNPIRARRRDDPTKIGWHCEHKSPACVPCYAERRNKWIGTGLPFIPQSLDQVEVYLAEDALYEPMGWLDAPGNVFVCSMTDLFAGFVLTDWIDDIHAIADVTPQLNHLMLTKREPRMAAYARDFAQGNGGRWRTNVWYGASVEDRRRLERVDVVRGIPAAVRFLSIEPLFEDVAEIDLRGIDWVIIGGTSGTIKHPLEIAWVRALIARCRAAGVAVFVKQLGAHVRDGGRRLALVHKKGGDPAEWPEDLRVREFPTPRLAA